MAPTVLQRLALAQRERVKRQEDELRGRTLSGKGGVKPVLTLVPEIVEIHEEVPETEPDVGSAPTVTDEMRSIPEAGPTAQYGCGHTYAAVFKHDFFGEVLEVQDEYLAARQSCGECMLAEVKPLLARCALCGFVIMPGEPVTAYMAGYEQKTEWVTRTPDGRGVLGCLRPNCCPVEPPVVGFWTLHGFKPLHLLTPEDAEELGVRIVGLDEAAADGGGKPDGDDDDPDDKKRWN